MTDEIDFTEEDQFLMDRYKAFKNHSILLRLPCVGENNIGFTLDEIIRLSHLIREDSK